MTSHLNHSELRGACYEVDRSTAWRDGEAQEQIARAFAEVLYQESLYHEVYLREMGRNLIARALRYVAHAHAIPPMGVGVSWCRDMLAAFIELACPNSPGRV